MTAVKGQSREVSGIAAELGRFGCFVVQVIVREAKEEASSGVFAATVRVTWH